MIIATVMLGFSNIAQSNEFEPQIRTFFDNNIKTWLEDPLIINAIKTQNAQHTALTATEIDTMDKTWRAEAKTGGGTLINATLSNTLSNFLKTKKSAHQSVITEMFIMDNKGLNVGQSDITSDYMQGDEAKWQKTYGSGNNQLFIDEVEFDDSTQSFQTQISATIVDPASGKPIGAITIGLNIENMM
ncbi:MAG: hypothetical protein HQM07_01375 [Zetaproteobacteria bacterium]|nr:hypothetical protein [Zetaproteobacteria bacterium]